MTEACGTSRRALTHSQLRQSAAQLLRQVVELLQLGLLLASVLADDLLLQPLVRLQDRGDETRRSHVFFTPRG